MLTKLHMYKKIIFNVALLLRCSVAVLRVMMRPKNLVKPIYAENSLTLYAYAQQEMDELFVELTERNDTPLRVAEAADVIVFMFAIMRASRAESEKARK